MSAIDRVLRDRIDLEEEFGRVCADAGFDEDTALLIASHDLFASDGLFAVNLNDTFGWACADCHPVTAETLAEVARLQRAWGRAGLTYWASKQRGWERSEFKDVNRAIDFVRREEEWRVREPSSSKRAYMDLPNSDLSRLRSIILSSHTAQCVPHYSERNMHAPECPIGELTGEEVERLFNTQSGRDPRGG